MPTLRRLPHLGGVAASLHLAAYMNTAERKALEAWRSGFSRCGVCWWPEENSGRRLEVHHICGGNARSSGHDPRNYLLLCNRCHGVYHSGRVYALTPDINLGTLLFVKRESDPENYQPQYLAELRHKKHLGKDPTFVPDFFLQERESHT